jgi:hypothetical protein
MRGGMVCVRGLYPRWPFHWSECDRSRRPFRGRAGASGVATCCVGRRRLGAAVCQFGAAGVFIADSRQGQERACRSSSPIGEGREQLESLFAADSQRAGASRVALHGRFAEGRERAGPLFMADTHEAGELRAGYVSGEDCQGDDIRTRGLAQALCHLKGAISGTVSRVAAPIYLPPDASKKRQTEVRLRNVIPLTIFARDIPRAQLPGLRRSDTSSNDEETTVPVP